MCLLDLQSFKESRKLLRRTLPVARRVLREGHAILLRMRWSYAFALYRADDATLDDLREAVTILEDVAPTARRVFGGAHPVTVGIERDLKITRAALRYLETPPRSA